MQVFIENILEPHLQEAVVAVLNDEAVFQCGKQTAGQFAQRVKHNQQANPDDTEVKGAVALIEKALLANSVFSAAAVPKRFAKLFFNRYQQGESYGFHVDNPVIVNTRTDLSFTLFLSEPSAYEGGELVLRLPSGDEEIKLPKGSLALYPSHCVHKVNEVTSGCRLAAVGWVESRVRRADQREILFDLEAAYRAIPDQPENDEAKLAVMKVKSNLARLWLD